MPKNERLVTIVDYGMGNIRSLSAAVTHLGWNSQISRDPATIATSETIILPGVGSFPEAMKSIRSQGIDNALRDAFKEGESRILGICLGMQLLMTSSDEDGGSSGLGIIDGDVGRFPEGIALPIPHIGFNSVNASKLSTLFAGLSESTDFYFVHSYRATNAAASGLVATSHYGETFIAAFEAGNVYGTQFHPEKSQSNGLALLSNFLSAELQ